MFQYGSSSTGFLQFATNNTHSFHPLPSFGVGINSQMIFSAIPMSAKSISFPLFGFGRESSASITYSYFNENGLRVHAISAAIGASMGSPVNISSSLKKYWERENDKGNNQVDLFPPGFMDRMRKHGVVRE